LTHDHWRFGAYVHNALDRRVALIPAVVNPIFIEPTLLSTVLINMPREMGLKFGYSF
jgi:hypothetical protein